jgi:hypothetical protein
MSKRPADPSENEGVPLKSGDREERKAQENGNGVGDFEDEFEDEYESEDEIFEAGVDGRPDEEREAEERRGTWFTPALRGLQRSSARVRHSQSLLTIMLLTKDGQMLWM